MSTENKKNNYATVPLGKLSNSLTIDHNTANQRLDRFLRKYFRPYPDISLVMIFKAIRTGQIKIIKHSQTDDKKSSKVDQSYSLQLGDIIVFHQSFLDLLTKKNPVEKKSFTEKKSLGSVSLDTFQSRIISEDDERLVINKPAGISIHPGQKVDLSNQPSSLYDLIKQYYSSRGFAGSMFQPNVAYRLDKETSGLVIVAKTYAGLQHLNEQIREHKVDKEYYALVIGKFPQQLTCNKPMKKIIDEKFGRGKMVICSPDDLLGQEAHTIGYNEKTRSETVLGPLSLVKVKITTGRMHQIRVHFAHAGYPILGDIVYGNPSHNRKLQQTYGFLRQLLHCHCYSFTDMNLKKTSFEAPLLEDFKKVVKE